ncbi:Peptidase inhibitor I78 family [Microdochium nivale]|nr:Peptidase inhibitor I78 family [Microdochium nivale]
MPLIDPVSTAGAEDPAQVWTTKLVGKTVTDDDHSESNFCKKDLPEEHRVIRPGQPTTRDFRPNRLNVHVTEEGTVTHVQHG